MLGKMTSIIGKMQEQFHGLQLKVQEVDERVSNDAKSHSSAITTSFNDLLAQHAQHEQQEIAKALANMENAFHTKIDKIALIQEEQNSSIEELGSQCHAVGESINSHVCSLQVSLSNL